jgi:arginyl-tRNA synthetase
MATLPAPRPCSWPSRSSSTPVPGANSSRPALEATPAYQRWVDAIEIAGPGFMNIRLKPAAKQEVVREVLAAGERFGCQPARAVSACWSNSSLPTPRARCTWAMAARRPWATPSATCSPRRAGACTASSITTTRACRSTPWPKSTQLRAKGFKPGDDCWPTDSDNPLAKNFYNGDYIADIAEAFKAKATVKADDREFTANGDVEDYDNIRQFAVAYLRNEQDKDLQAFNLHFDEYYLESSLYTSGRVEATVNKLIANGKTYEQDGALWLKSTDYGDDKDRVMRKGDGTYTYFVPDVAYHITKWERGFHKVVNIQGTDHHGTIARVRAGLQAADVGIPQGYPDYVLHTMVRVVKGGEEVKISKRAGSYVTLRDLIEWTSKDAVRFFLLSPQARHRIHLRRRPGRGSRTTTTRCTTCSTRMRASARCCVAWQEAMWQRCRDVDLSALDGPQAQALMLQLAKYPEMLTAAAEGEAPHDVTFYLRDLAASYHSYYDAERILVDDEAVKRRAWRSSPPPRRYCTMAWRCWAYRPPARM